MNLELIFPIFMIFCAALGCVIAYVLGESILLGASLGLFVGFSPLFILGIAYYFMQMWRHDRPDCVCGECKSGDYHFIDSQSNINERIYFFKCPHCGREYRWHGNRFEVSTPEGLKPHMKISRWGRWVKDLPDKRT